MACAFRKTAQELFAEGMSLLMATASQSAMVELSVCHAFACKIIVLWRDLQVGRLLSFHVKLCMIMQHQKDDGQLQDLAASILTFVQE